MTWRRIGTGCLAACAAMGFVGCVSLPDYDRVKRARDTATKINEDLKRRADQLEQELDDLKAEIRTYGDLKAELERQTQRNTELSAALREALEGRGGAVLPWPATAGEFQVNPQTGGLVLQVSVYFASGQAAIRENMKPKVRRLAELIREKDPNEDYLIYVDGYTDRQPVKVTKEKNPDNWFLGCRRAHAVMSFLHRECGFPIERFVVTSWGYLNEIEPMKEVSEKNRRVEIRLISRAVGRAAAVTEEGK